MRWLIVYVALGMSVSARVNIAGAKSATNLYRSYPPVVQPAEGLSWPTGQALPIFAEPADGLDAIDVRLLGSDERITFSALQGQVNRTKPRVYLVDSRSDEGRDTWANTSTMNLQVGRFYTREDKFDLVAKYAKEVSGMVLYDPTISGHYRNLAGTVAGLRRALPVSLEVRERLLDNGIKLEVVEDLTKLTWTSPVQIYEHLYERYWPDCEKRLLISARPDARRGDLHHTRDIAAACGAAVVWLDNRIPEEKAVMRNFFGDMRAGEAVVLGWYSTERSGITTASEFGIGTLPADHYISGSVYSGTDHRIEIPEVPRMPALEDKVYVALFISDGDNIQYTQRAMRRIWDRSAADRGRIPLSWTIAPGLVDIGPGILNYYYRTATANDCFVTGPSGMGYMMPYNTLEEPGAPVGLYLEDESRMRGYARLAETYLQRSGLRVITIWDQATPMHRAVYEQYCRNLYGATVQNFRDVPSVEGSVVEGRVRFDKLVIPYASGYDHLDRSLRRALRGWDGGGAKFLSYQVSIWSELKPGPLVELVQAVRDDFPDSVRFVRADHYFNLYNQAHGLPFNLCLLPGIRATSGVENGVTEASMVIDGTPATIWSPPSKDRGENPWLELDFNENYLFERMVIRHAGAHGLDRQLNTREFLVRTKPQEGDWITLAEFNDHMASVTDFEFDPVAARQVRIEIKDAGADGVTRIAEVEVFGAVQP